MQFGDLINTSENEFTDISSELFRQYSFGNGAELVIQDPIALSVSASGGHRVLDASGTSYYVPTGWNYLHWKTRDGSPHFVK